MPLPKTGIITLSVAGPMTFSSICPGLTPKWIKLRVGCRSLGDPVTHWSEGQFAGGTTVCDSMFRDSIGGSGYKGTARIVSWSERVGGVVTETLAANNPVPIVGGFTVNVLVPNPSVPVTYELM